jgi:hypothetical protein
MVGQQIPPTADDTLDVTRVNETAKYTSVWLNVLNWPNRRVFHH